MADSQDSKKIGLKATIRNDQILNGVAERSERRQPWKDMFLVKELLEKQNQGRCTTGDVRLQNERDQHIFLGG